MTMLRTVSYAAMVVLLGAIAGAQSAATPPAGDADRGPATQPSSEGMVDPVAQQVWRESAQYLAQSRAFSLHAEVWKDEVLASGHKIQVTRLIDLDFRRPDGLHVAAHAHHKGRSVWFDGKTVTVLEHEKNLYGVADAPGTVDQALDILTEDYGITVPLEDLVLSDPYGSSMKHVTEGGYFGDEPVLGEMCRHIGFSTNRIDWQLWVAKGAQPLPRKLVITYKTEDQSPQYTAVFTKWDVTDRASDLAFQFIPPNGSVRIPLIDEKPKNGQHRHETEH